MTSFDVIIYLKELLKQKKMGHAGTLDPGAIGVLPVCIGKATKAVEYIMEMEKEYRAELTLGTSTDTQDSYGKILSVKNVFVSKEVIINEIEKFVGEIYQIPPMYSALKVQGKRLFELAREGITIEREPRKVFISSINILNVDMNKHKVILDVSCSKGTYIRTLCNDIGDKLGCGGHMSSLIRKRTGVFHISSAVTLEEISKVKNEEQVSKLLFGIDTVFSGYESICLNRVCENQFRNGRQILLDTVTKLDENMRTNINREGLLIKIYNENDTFLALGKIVKRNRDLFIKSEKMFI